MNNNVTVTINNEAVQNIAQGLPMIDSLDETLDTSTIILKPVTRKERYNIFSEVVITINGISKYYYVTEDDVDIACKQPILYSHTVQLIEPTKLLERIPCDNLTFTQPADQAAYPTPIANNTATIYDVVMRIRECCMLRRVDSVRPYPFEVPAALADYLKTIPAPQFFLNSGNVKDALNQVFKYLNAISRLDNFTDLNVDFFNKYNNLLMMNDIIDYGETQNVENYATSLMSNISNAIADTEDNQSSIRYPGYYTRKTIRSEDGLGQLTTANMMFPTETPIYEVKKLIVFIKTNGGGQISQNEEITKFVVEKNVWSTLPIKSTWYRYTNPDTKRTYWELNTIGKDCALIYDYTGKSIYGFGEGYKTMVFFTKTVIDTIAAYIYGKIGDLLAPPNEDTTVGIADWVELSYNIEYVTTSDIRVEVQRIDLSDYIKYSTTTVNQANNLVNSKAFGDNMKGLLERMGNADRIYTKIFKKYEDCPIIGDYTTDGYVLTTLQKGIYNDYVVCVLGMTKNFNRRSQFVDISSEIRQFVIPASNQSLVRHCNYAEYIVIDSTNSVLDDNSSMLTSRGFETFLTSLITREDYHAYRYAPMIALFEIPYDTNNYLLRQVDSRGFANSVVFTIGFDDNRAAGNSVGSINQKGTKWYEQAVSYTNSAGALQQFGIKLVTDIEIINNIEAAAVRGQKLPAVDKSKTYYNESLFANFMCYKDAAEILRMSLQIHILPSKNLLKKLLIGQGLTQENWLTQYSEDNDVRTISIFEIEDRFQQYETQFVRGTKVATLLESALDIKKGKITLPALPEGKSWCIGNEQTGSLYLAYNPGKGEAQPTELFFSRKINR